VVVDAWHEVAKDLSLLGAATRRAMDELANPSARRVKILEDAADRAAAADDKYLTAQEREDARVEAEGRRLAAKGAAAAEAWRNAQIRGPRSAQQVAVDKLARRARALQALAFLLEDSADGDEQAAYEVIAAASDPDEIEARMIADARRAQSRTARPPARVRRSR
jgi:hypothetical protein